MVTWQLYVCTLRTARLFFPKGSYNFPFPSVMYEISSCFPFSPRSDLNSVFHLRHSPGAQEHSLLALICLSLRIHAGHLSVRISAIRMAPLVKQLFALLFRTYCSFYYSLSFEKFLHILNITPFIRFDLQVCSLQSCQSPNNMF